jgi:hypothetical protein
LQEVDAATETVKKLSIGNPKNKEEVAEVAQAILPGAE